MTKEEYGKLWRKALEDAGVPTSDEKVVITLGTPFPFDDKTYGFGVEIKGRHKPIRFGFAERQPLEFMDYWARLIKIGYDNNASHLEAVEIEANPSHPARPASHLPG